MKYYMEIHHEWTLWFWGEKTSRLNAKMSPIIGHLVAILTFFNQMWIIMENNLGYFLLSNYKNKDLNLSCARKVKPFFDLHFLQWWCETFHMPTFRTLITNQHGNNFHKLFSQHTMRFNMDNHQGWINLAIHIRKMTWCTNTHMIFLPLTISTFKQHIGK
jgi:hypothetical protein